MQHWRNTKNYFKLAGEIFPRDYWAEQCAGPEDSLCTSPVTMGRYLEQDRRLQINIFCHQKNDAFLLKLTNWAGQIAIWDSDCDFKRSNPYVFLRFSLFYSWGTKGIRLKVIFLKRGFVLFCGALEGLVFLWPVIPVSVSRWVHLFYPIFSSLQPLLICFMGLYTTTSALFFSYYILMKSDVYVLPKLGLCLLSSCGVVLGLWSFEELHEDLFILL